MDAERTQTIGQAIEDYLASERARSAKAKKKQPEEAERYNIAAALYGFIGVSVPGTTSQSQTGHCVSSSRDVSDLKAPDVARYAEEEVRKGADIEARLRPVKDFLNHLKKKGIHQESLSVHVKIPRPPVAKGEKQTATVGFQSVAVTESGLEARKKELEDLKAQRPEIIAAIRTAAADKDYRENAPLDAAREEQGKAEARIRELEEEILRAEVVETAAGSRAGVDATVSLHGLDDGTTKSYKLVDPIEANPSEGKLSIKSPVGEAVVGKRKGDRVTIKTPSGSERRYRIENVTF